MNTIVAASTLALALAGWSTRAGAQSGHGGAPLLDLDREAQLERWLGRGDQRFTNLFTRQPGDTSPDFHAAADGKGPTFTLMQVSDRVGNSWLVGGYNPQSWSATDGWHVTERDSQRTAFIFNYTAPAVYRQVPSTYILPTQGARQTYNAPDHGPNFGAGPDLFSNDRLDATLSWQLTYGDPATEGMSIIDHTLGARLRSIDALEVYAIRPIPEAPATAMLAAGLGLIGVAARRRRTCAS